MNEGSCIFLWRTWSKRNNSCKELSLFGSTWVGLLIMVLGSGSLWPACVHGFLIVTVLMWRVRTCSQTTSNVKAQTMQLWTKHVKPRAQMKKRRMKNICLMLLLKPSSSGAVECVFLVKQTHHESQLDVWWKNLWDQECFFRKAEGLIRNLKGS